MKQIFLIFGLMIVVIGGLTGLSFGLGWVNVGYTKTVGKAQQNAQRTVFEETQSYVEGKRQEVAKFRYEYLKSKDPQEKTAIRSMLRSSLANFDKTKLDQDMVSFLDSISY